MQNILHKYISLFSVAEFFKKKIFEVPTDAFLLSKKNPNTCKKNLFHELHNIVDYFRSCTAKGDALCPVRSQRFTQMLTERHTQRQTCVYILPIWRSLKCLQPPGRLLSTVLLHTFTKLLQ